MDLPRSIAASSPLFVAALVSSWPAGVIYAEEYYSFEEAQALAFPEADAWKKCRVILTDPEKKARLEARLRATRVSRIFTYWQATKQGRVLGYMVEDNVIGKTQPITYVLATDTDFAARLFEVRVYRESHGFEIRRKAFRDQFSGKESDDTLVVGRDIRNIAGATMSCNAVTDGVHDQLVYLEELVEPAIAEPVAPHATSAPVAPAMFTRDLMGTTLAVQVVADDPAAAAEVAFAEVARLEALFSVFQEASDIARLNAAAGGKPLSIASDTAELLGLARAASMRTKGAFDPTAAPLGKAWAASGAAPEEAAIDAARQLCGWRHLELDGSLARLAVPGAALDLGAIAKGYALDKAAARLEAEGVSSCLLNFGGQILATAPPPGEKGWEVALRDPRRPDSAPTRLLLVNESLATSADYERAREDGSSHIVDPRSGHLASGMLGVSVFAKTATDADALSTALFVMEPREAADFARREGLAARIHGGESVEETPAWRARGATESTRQ